MSKVRAERQLPAEGKCGECGTSCPGVRWCTDSCRVRWLIRNRPAYARKEVLRRDRGVCGLCATDCRLQELVEGAPVLEDWTPGAVDWLASEWKWIQAPFLYLSEVERRERDLVRSELEDLADARRLDPDFGQHKWEADHIIPVSENGGQCTLDNLRTLCLPCHRKVTELLRWRSRRPERRTPPLPGLELFY